MNETINFEIKGLHCPDCPAKIERAVFKLDGVRDIQVNYTHHNGHVTFNKDVTGFSHIIERINKLGFEVIYTEK